MKNALLVLAGLSLLATSAFASKARLTSLGQEANGSAYVKDIRSLYYNAAYVTKGEFATFEFGNTAGTTTTAPTAPNAEGAFVRKLAGYDFGLTLGRRSSRFDTLVTAANTALATDVRVGNNSTEVVVGGNATNLTWGAGLMVAQAEDEAPAGGNKSTASSLELRGGVIASGWEAFAELYPSAKAEVASTSTAEGKFGFKVGGSYDLSDATLFGDLKVDGGKWKANNNSVDQESDVMVLRAGYAQTQKVGEGVDFIWSAGLTMDNTKTKDKVTTNSDVTNNYLYIPLVVALEAQATDWMTVRGAVTQKVLLDRYENGTGSTTTDSHATNTTSVAAGVGFKWKKLVMDATLEGANGTTGNAGKVNGTALLANGSLSYYF